MPSQVVSLAHEALLSWWLNYRVLGKISKDSFDLLHFTKADVPIRKILPTVVTVYDVIPLLFPESQSLTRKWYWPRALHRCATYADHIITISQASKRDIVSLLGVEESRVTVTPLSVDTNRFSPGVVARDGVPYILFVATRDQRKNVRGLIRAFDKIKHDIPHKLVVVGRDALVSDGANAEALSLNLMDRVSFLSDINDADLLPLYQGADLFVWPSIYEGWGLPPLEAMACGVPTIVCNGGSLPEVVGKAGVVVSFSTDVLSERLYDEGFETKLSRAMANVLTDSSKSNELRKLGPVHAKSFSWDALARDTIGVYNSVSNI